MKTEIQRIGGHLKEVITLFDDSGKPISQIINPLMVELRPRDMAQIFIGALLMATPLCFTEEVWVLSESLPVENFIYLFLCSFFAVTLFVFFNFYRFKLKGHIAEFIKRIIAIYLITAISVALVLFLINKLPLTSDNYIGLKRIILIGFPAVFGATITDSLK